ncbi:MAG TPA: T9SS type A sorting domain-containing protein [Ignavibacteriaceae bacterium]|nr:T9SS type A sorting domain-containing protein [Ignavibacteriaceae bacterium]
MLAIVIFLIVFTVTSSPQTHIFPHFSDLRGMEMSDNTQLFYRINHSTSGSNYSSSDRSIFHFNVTAGTERLFLRDYYEENILYSQAVSVDDFTFWHSDTAKYIYSGYEGGWCAWPFIRRWDDSIPNSSWISAHNIHISNQNDSLVFALPSNFSTDGGHNWEIFPNNMFSPEAVSPYNDSVIFASNSDYTGTRLHKSTNRGTTFTLVDSVSRGYGSWDYFFDLDPRVLYRKVNTDGYFCLIRSENFGNAGSWFEIYRNRNDFFIAIDQSKTGHIYLGTGRNIFISTDFGTIFYLWKKLSNKTLGIYKKPETDILYAITKYSLLKLTGSSTEIINSREGVTNEITLFPIRNNNKWIYRVYDINQSGDSLFKGLRISEVSGDTVIGTKKYTRIRSSFTGSLDSAPASEYFRIDSLNLQVYKLYDSLVTGIEFIYLDLLAEAGDSLVIAPAGNLLFLYVDNLAFRMHWGTYREVLSQRILNTPGTYSTQFIRNLGLSLFETSFQNTHRLEILSGCIIDGVVHGDTTTITGTDDELTELPSEYSLSQNYPNPFNPGTVIRYQLPVNSKVILTIYDILGKEVTKLVNEEQEAGSHTVKFNASKLVSGVYICRIIAGDFVKTIKMSLVK